MPFAAIFTGLKIFGAAVSLLGAVNAYRHQNMMAALASGQADLRRMQTEVEVDAARLRGETETVERLGELNREMSGSIAVAGASGLGLTGSPGQMLARQEEFADRDVGRISSDTRLRVLSARISGLGEEVNLRSQSASHKQRGKQALVSGIGQSIQLGVSAYKMGVDEGYWS